MASSKVLTSESLNEFESMDDDSSGFSDYSDDISILQPDDDDDVMFGSEHGNLNEDNEEFSYETCESTSSSLI